MNDAPRPAPSLGLWELVAIGVGGMIGGGIFSVLGIAVGIAGHAAPLAFALGGVIAVLAGYSYVKLALAYRDDGASFTYLERAFPKAPHIAGVMGWIIVVGYIGTLSLYAYTFGAYGADLFGSADSGVVRRFLSIGVLLVFLVVNLRGARTSGLTEDLIVYSKIALLALVGAFAMRSVRVERLTPIFDEGAGSVFIAGATVFVAFEGFQLITNAVIETKNPTHNIPRGIYASIVITTTIYVLLAVVAVGSLSQSELVEAKEYALAAAARPALGEAGTVIVGLAALLATSSAINATAFGASRLMSQIATERMLPRAFSFRRRDSDTPEIAIVVFIGLGIVFTSLGTLDIIATFSSLTFLLVSFGVGVANLRLRATTRANPGLILAGLAVVAVTIALLLWHMWTKERDLFYSVAGLYAAILVGEIGFTKRGLLFRGRA
ncbi:MAG: amino acid permease [Planctomycetota bacterium]|nr:MAG: amino acid permease [Planctomycetota bacterium]